MSGNDHISCLPPELLLHIFRHALPGPLNKDGRVHFQAIRSVCSKWRLISFSSPALWSSLTLLHLGGNLYPSVGNSAERWLARAGSSIPLDLQLVDSSNSGMSVKDREALILLITRYRSRWRSLFIIGTGTLFWDIFQQIMPSDWVNLRTLTISTYRLCDGTGEEGIGVLRRVTSIQSTLLRNLRLCIGAAARAVTDFQFISKYTHLRKLSITKHTPSTIPTVTTSLPCLEILTMSTYDLNLLTRLNTPALCELEIDILHGGGDAQDVILRSFLTHCPRLLSVSLRGNSEPIAWMTPALSSRPTITSVIVEPWPAASFDDKTWCPNLRSLTVVVHSKVSIQEDENEMALMRSIASFLERRNERGREKLDKLVFKCTYGATSFPHELFGTLGVGRLDVTVPW
ncbi:hypothetical protein BKA70DRAFT_1164401 [Coprinopsis sp. MPI-PUGE-AT-0042]|nr:hypothetical protein BKA70DRAFT_1164401 [Coprinopsis sp. MPI-PUGE-AT-0042]